MNPLDEVSAQLLKFGNPGFEELYFDSEKKIPYCGPKRIFFGEKERLAAEKFAIQFFSEHRKLVDAGYHVSERILFSDSATMEAKLLFQHFGAVKFSAKMIDEAKAEAKEIVEKAQSEAAAIRKEISEKLQYGLECVEAVKAKAKEIAAESEEVEELAHAKAEELERCAHRNLVLSQIRVERVKQATKPWNVTRDFLLDTFIESTEVERIEQADEGIKPVSDSTPRPKLEFEIVRKTSSELIPACSAILRQVPYFKTLFENPDPQSSVPIAWKAQSFEKLTNGNALKYYVRLDIPRALIGKYLDYLENPAIIHDPSLYNEETLSCLYRFGISICDKALVDAIEAFANTEFTNEELLLRLKICGCTEDFASKYSGSFNSLIELGFDYISPQVMSMMLDYGVVPFKSELELWVYFLDWVNFKAKNSNRTIEGFLLDNATLLNKIHFERMSKDDGIKVLRDERLGLSIRYVSTNLLKPFVGKRSRIYVQEFKKGDGLTIRYAFTDFRKKEFKSETFTYEGYVFCLWSDPEENEKVFFGVKNCSDKPCNIRLKTCYLGNFERNKDEVEPTDGLGEHIPLSELKNLTCLEIEFNLKFSEKKAK